MKFCNSTAPASRRTFLKLAGSVAVAGVLTHSADAVALSGERNRQQSGAMTVDASRIEAAILDLREKKLSCAQATFLGICKALGEQFDGRAASGSLRRFCGWYRQDVQRRHLRSPCRRRHGRGPVSSRSDRKGRDCGKTALRAVQGKGRHCHLQGNSQKIQRILQLYQLLRTCWPRCGRTFATLKEVPENGTFSVSTGLSQGQHSDRWSPGSRGGLPQVAGAASAQARTQVFFSRDISIDSLLRLYACVSQHMTGKVAIKMHTGEPNGPNILPVAWAQRLLDVIPQSRVGGGALLPKQFTQ